MKKLLTAIFAIAFTLSVSAQKTDTIPKKDSLTANTKFLSINDIFGYAEPLKDKTTAKQFETFTTILNEILKEAIAEWNRKNTIQPPVKKEK